MSYRLRSISSKPPLSDQRKVEAIAACRRLGLGPSLHIDWDGAPRINMAPDAFKRELWRMTWQQLERIGAGEDVARVLGGSNERTR